MISREVLKKAVVPLMLLGWSGSIVALHKMSEPHPVDFLHRETNFQLTDMPDSIKPIVRNSCLWRWRQTINENAFLVSDSFIDFGEGSYYQGTTFKEAPVTWLPNLISTSGGKIFSNQDLKWRYEFQIGEDVWLMHNEQLITYETDLQDYQYLLPCFNPGKASFVTGTFIPLEESGELYIKRNKDFSPRKGFGWPPARG